MNTIATRLLLELGHASDLVMAEPKVKEVGSIINIIRPEMKQELNVYTHGYYINLNYLGSNNAIRRKLTFFLLGFRSIIVTFFIRKYNKSLKCW